MEEFYSFFFSVSLYILFYTALMNPHLRTIPGSKISLVVFEQLYREHAETLSCPCSTIKIPLKAFVSTTIKFHPVCSSIFISQEWIRALYLKDASRYGTGDFRTTASSQVSPWFFFRASCYPSKISFSRMYYMMNSKNHLLFYVYAGILLVSNKKFLMLTLRIACKLHCVTTHWRSSLPPPLTSMFIRLYYISRMCFYHIQQSFVSVDEDTLWRQARIGCVFLPKRLGHLLG